MYNNRINRCYHEKNGENSKLEKPYHSCVCINQEFKKNQSKNYKDNNYARITIQHDQFLQNEFRRYGLISDNMYKKHNNTPNSYIKSKTTPNLISNKKIYVENLKKEIQNNKTDIPVLPNSYAEKYVKTLKNEVFLNKLTTQHNDKEKVKDIKKEIQNFRQKQIQQLQQKPFIKTKITTEFKLMGDVEKFRRRKKSKNRKRGKSRKDTSSDRSPKGTNSECSNENSPKNKNLKENSTQCQIDVTTNKIRLDLINKFKVIDTLIPQISEIIEKSERNLEHIIFDGFQTYNCKNKEDIQNKTDNEEVPPKEIIETQEEEKQNLRKSKEIPKECELSVPGCSWQTPPPELPKKNDETNSLSSTSSSKRSTSLPIKASSVSELFENFEIIKENRNLLKIFKTELETIRKDIENCTDCKPEEKCSKHMILVPLLEIDNETSINEQIKLFNKLKQEINLKNEIEHQIKKIKKLENSFKNKPNNKNIEQELLFRKSYVNNLMVKQKVERVLDEQEIAKEKCLCTREENCKKCILEEQIHELLTIIQENINEDIKKESIKLNIQKLPIVSIPPPLTLQTTLKLDIQPSTPPKEWLNNIKYEKVIVSEASIPLSSQKDEKTIPLISRTVQTIPSEASIPLSLKDGKTMSSKTVQTSVPKIIKDTKKHEQNIDLKAKIVQCNLALPKISSDLKETPSDLDLKTKLIQCDILQDEINEDNIDEITEKLKETEIENRETTKTGRDSDYLFGFKEYLMKKTHTPSNTPTELKNDETSTQLNESLENLRKKYDQPKKSCDFQGVTLIIPSSSTVSNTDENDEEAKRKPKLSRQIERKPSIKLMMYPTEPNSNIMNHEPRYKLKRYSIADPENVLDEVYDRSEADTFYRTSGAPTDENEIPPTPPILPAKEENLSKELQTYHFDDIAVIKDVRESKEYESKQGSIMCQPTTEVNNDNNTNDSDTLKNMKLVKELLEEEVKIMEDVDFGKESNEINDAEKAKRVENLILPELIDESIQYEKVKKKRLYGSSSDTSSLLTYNYNNELFMDSLHEQQQPKQTVNPYQVAQERIRYLKKCTKFEDKSVNDSIRSAGEIKEKEECEKLTKDRQHYNHWVNYYTQGSTHQDPSKKNS